jgi:hypothetical protein
LGSIMWKNDSAGRIQIEAKEDIISRLGVSPDYADAAVMAFARANAVTMEMLNALMKNRPEGITDGLLDQPLC